MNHKTFQLAGGMDLSGLENQLALQCAPLLTGIKISNLFIVNHANSEDVIKMFEGTVVSYFILYKSEEKVTFLLYIERKLEDYLMNDKVRNVMRLQGYRKVILNDILKEVSKRYEKYMNEKAAFPHELGLLLGYPADDVIGFIENNGKNSLYTGYWKVYSNLREAVNVFHKYNQAKETVIQLVSQGKSITYILEGYHTNKKMQIAI